MPRSHKMGPSRRLLLATVLGLLPLGAMGVQQYCSPANTGSNFLAGERHFPRMSHRRHLAAENRDANPLVIRDLHLQLQWTLF
jgi:hypothetical protein